MSQTTLAVLGISSGIVNTVGLVPYIRDVLNHKTKPERATWWVWLALTSVALIAQIQSGAKWSLVFTIANILAVGLIAVLSLHYGFGNFHRRDLVSLVLTAVGLIVAQFIHSPLFALLVVIGVDFTGYWLTLYKTWFAPHTETFISWILATLSALLGVLAVGQLNLAQLAYPFYIFVGNLALVVVIWFRRPIVSAKQIANLHTDQSL